MSCNLFERSSGSSSENYSDSKDECRHEDTHAKRVNENFLDSFGRICFWGDDGFKRFRPCKFLKNENISPDFERHFHGHEDIEDFYKFAIAARRNSEKGKSADLADDVTKGLLQNHERFLDQKGIIDEYNFKEETPLFSDILTRLGDEFNWHVDFGFIDPAAAGGFVVVPGHDSTTSQPVIYGLTDHVITDPQLEKIVAVQFQAEGNERLGFLHLLHCAVGRKALAGILVCENKAAVIWFEDVGQATKIHKYPHSGLAECSLKKIVEIIAHLVYLACDFSDPFDWTLWRQYERVEADPDKPNMRQMPILCADGSVKNFVRHSARIDDV